MLHLRALGSCLITTDLRGASFSSLRVTSRHAERSNFNWPPGGQSAPQGATRCDIALEKPQSFRGLFGVQVPLLSLNWRICP